MRFCCVNLFLMCAGSLCALPSIHAWQKPAFLSQTDLVPAYVSVRDSSGRLVAGLSASSFEVRDNGRAVEVAALAGDDEPKAVAVIMSFGAMLSEDGDNDLIGAVRTLIRGLRPDDRAWVGNVMGREPVAVTSRETGWPPGFIWHHNLLERSMWDALDGTLTALAGSANRKLVVAVTGGDDDNVAFPSRQATVSAKHVAIRFERIGAALYELKLPGAASDAGLGPLVKATGGQTLRISQSSQVGGRIVELLDDMRHAYLLGFVPAVLDGKTHSIQIKCRVPRTTVRSRTQYVADLAKSR